MFLRKKNVAERLGLKKKIQNTTCLSWNEAGQVGNA
jgi:hypothetical protein